MLALLLRNVPPFFLLGVALLLGGLVGLPRLRPGDLSPRLLLLGVYGLFAYHLCLFLALRSAPPVEADLLNHLWPLLIVVLTPIVLPGTHLRPHHLIGAGMGFLGAVVLAWGKLAGFDRSALGGYGLALAAALIWSTYSLLTRRLGPFPTAAVSGFCILSGALALACHALFEPVFRPTLRDSLLLLAIGLGPMGAAFYLWDRAMKDGDPRVIGTLSYASPLLSVFLIAVSGLGSFTPAAAVAAALIVGGMVVGTRG